MNLPHFFYPHITGNFGCFKVFLFMNNAALNTLVMDFTWE